MLIEWDRPVYALAPLAGFTDRPFRSVVKRFGADLTVSEMISSNALAYGNAKTTQMLQKSPLETPYSVQIAGSDPEIIRRAVEVINAHDGIDIIDLNAGCPVPKVTNNGQGSALLTDPDTLMRAIEAIKTHSNKPLTSVKMRLGFTHKDHVRLAQACEAAGADFLTVHGRTRTGKYRAPVDYDAIAEVKASVSIPVIANGDIDSPAKARWVLEHTRCDGVMIGRAAVGRPWIFQQIKQHEETPDPALIAAVVLEHFDQMISHYGAYGAILFRKHLHTYSKVGYPGAAAFRQRINVLDDPAQVRETIAHFFAQPLHEERE